MKWNSRYSWIALKMFLCLCGEKVIDRVVWIFYPCENGKSDRIESFSICVESYFCVRRHIVCNSSMLYAYKLRVSKTFFMYLSAKKMTILGWINNNNATAATKSKERKTRKHIEIPFQPSIPKTKKIERRFFVCRQIQRWKNDVLC